MHHDGCLPFSRVRSVNHTRPLASIATLRGSPCRFHMSGPNTGDGVGDALKPDTMAGALVGVLTIVAVFVFGSSTFSASFICETPKTSPFALLRPLRVSAAARSARPSIGVPQSHSETTTLR